MALTSLLLQLLSAGWAGLLEYVSAHVFFCLVPAFFLAGALNVLIPQNVILKFLGRKAKPIVSYGIAAIAGLSIEVCSCTILPLFAGIWKKGSGLGPAITFLYAGPAINIAAVSLTAAVIGWDIAIARLVLSVLFAVLIGVIMAIVFAERKTPPEDTPREIHGDIKHRAAYQQALFFGVLTLILLLGTAPLTYLLGEKPVSLLGGMELSSAVKYFGTAALVVILLVISFSWYTREELAGWMKETWKFVRMIFPLLLIGVFFASMIGVLMPQGIFIRYMGRNTLFANLLGVLFGTFAYFPALVEVPIAAQFLHLGMHKGPLLSYLLADPVISLQTILVINKILKPTRTLTYVALIVLTTTAAGLLFGALFT